LTTVKADSHFVDCDIATGPGGDWDQTGTSSPAAGSYPTLHELDASEIPAKPTAPTVSDGSTGVANYAQLQAMNGANSYILTADINLSGETWTPIANFSGTLDGDGYTISNLSSTNGLFSTTNAGAKFKDLTLSNFTVSVFAGTERACLVGQVNGGDITAVNVNIENSSVSINRGGDHSGTLIGYIVIGDGNIKIHNCTITNCTVESLNGAGDYLGHFLGLAENGNASSSGCQITDCTVSGGSIYGKQEIGGFIGDVYNDGAGADLFQIHSCNTSSTVTATETSVTCTGGFMGAGLAVEVTSCYCTGTVSVDEYIEFITYVGGFNGFDLGGASQYTNCYTTSPVVLEQPSEFFPVAEVGGFVGVISATGITNYLRCYTTSDITIDNASTTTFIGGFAGEIVTDDATKLTFDRCFARGDITITNGASAYRVGGFCGYIYANDGTADDYVKFQDCYCWGKVIAENGAWNASTTYGQAGFMGDVREGSSLANGFTITADNCYCAQTVDRLGSTSITNGVTYTASNTGAFYGRVANTKTVQNETDCFFDEETCSFTQDWSDATNHVTSIMMTKATYTDAGWSFSTLDGVKDDINSIWMIVADSATAGTSDQYRTVDYPNDWAHLEGETVQVLGDGIYKGEEAVSGGQVTLDDDTTNNHVGLKVVSKLQPMKLDGESQVKRISKIIPDVYESVDGEYGKELDDMYAMTLRDSNDIMDRDGELYSGYVELPFKGQYDRSADIWITQDIPLGMNVLPLILIGTMAHS
jgi:hypothetical protein